MLKNGVTSINANNNGLQPSIGKIYYDNQDAAIWNGNQPKSEETSLEKKIRESQEKFDEMIKDKKWMDKIFPTNKLFKLPETDADKSFNHQKNDNHPSEKTIETKQNTAKEKHPEIDKQYGIFGPLLELEKDNLPRHYKKTKKSIKHNKQKQTKVNKKETNELIKDQDLIYEIPSDEGSFTAFPVPTKEYSKINISNCANNQSRVEIEIKIFDYYPAGCSSIKKFVKRESILKVEDQCERFPPLEFECSDIPKKIIEENQQNSLKPSINFNTTIITPKKNALSTVENTLKEIWQIFKDYDKSLNPYRKNNTFPPLDYANYDTNIHRAFGTYQNQFLKNCLERPLPDGDGVFWKYPKGDPWWGSPNRIKLTGGNGNITISEKSEAQTTPDYANVFLNGLTDMFRYDNTLVKEEFSLNNGTVSVESSKKFHNHWIDFSGHKENQDKQFNKKSQDQRERDRKEAEEREKKLREAREVERKLREENERNSAKCSEDKNQLHIKFNKTTTELNKKVYDLEQQNNHLFTGFIVSVVTGLTTATLTLIVAIATSIIYYARKCKRDTNRQTYDTNENRELLIKDTRIIPLNNVETSGTIPQKKREAIEKLKLNAQKCQKDNCNKAIEYYDNALEILEEYRYLCPRDWQRKSEDIKNEKKRVLLAQQERNQQLSEELQQLIKKQGQNTESIHKTALNHSKINFTSCKKIVDNSDATYKQYSVIGDGDCGFTSFGIARDKAHELLKNNVNKISNLVKPAVKDALLLEKFLKYLKDKGVIPENITLEMVDNSMETYASNSAIIAAYLDYDVKEKQIYAGFAHPAVLQALAEIQGIELHIWQLGENEKLIPHAQKEYAIYQPTSTKQPQRCDILFVNNNHFDLLELSKYQDGIDYYPVNNYSGSLQNSNLILTQSKNITIFAESKDAEKGKNDLFKQQSDGNLIKNVQQIVSKFDSINVKYKAVFTQYGDTLRQQRRYDEAIKLYDKALQIDKDYEPAKTGRQAVQQQKQTEDKTNEKICQQIKSNQDAAEAFILQKDYLNAIKKYEEILENLQQQYPDSKPYCPSWKDIYIKKGVALLKLKKYSQSSFCVEKALALDQNYKPAKELEKELQAAISKGKIQEISQTELDLNIYNICLISDNSITKEKLLKDKSYIYSLKTVPTIFKIKRTKLDPKKPPFTFLILGEKFNKANKYRDVHRLFNSNHNDNDRKYITTLFEQYDFTKSVSVIIKAKDVTPQMYNIISTSKNHVRNVLGAGGFGFAYTANWLSEKIEIVKKELNDQKTFSPDGFREEAGIMTKYGNHPNIIKCYGICTEDNYYGFFMEFMTGGSLLNLLRQKEKILTWKKRWVIALGISLGLQHLHRNNITHRDLKSENVLLNKNLTQIKLSDFGLSKDNNQIISITYSLIALGTVPYMSPELIAIKNGTSHSKPDFYKTDIYSFGVVLWELVAHKPIWEKEEDKDLSDIATRKKIPDECPPSLSKLITQCLSLNPNNRPNIDEIIKTLEDNKAEICNYDPRKQDSSLLLTFRNWLLPNNMPPTDKQEDNQHVNLKK